MTEKRPPAVIYVYLIPGTLTRDEDGWCDTCQRSSIWAGPVWRLDPWGVSPHGHTRACLDCKTWTNTPPDRNPLA